MFSAIYLFELKYRIKRPATWIYFGVFFLLGFGFMILTGGAVSGISVAIGGGGKTFANSPYALAGLISSLSFFGTLIVSAIVGNPVCRDFEHNTHALFFTKPLSKIEYLGGRFFGAMTIALLVLLAIALGLYLGTLTPWVVASRIGPFNLMAYLQPYILVVIPNIFFTGAIFFTSATLARSMIPNYVGCVFLLVLFGVAQLIVSNLDNQSLAAMLDPLGSQAIDNTTRYWTSAEKNTLLLPVSKLLLYNRLIWMGAGGLIFGFCFWRFKFGQAISDKKAKPVSQQLAGPVLREEIEKVIPGTTKKFTLPKVVLDFSFRNALRQWWMLTKLEFKGIVGNPYFLAILFAGLTFLFIGGSQVGKMYDTPTLPVTYQVTDLLSGTFALFMLIVIIFYSGELVWREREAKIDQMIDALPVAGGIGYLSKLFALMLVQLLMLGVVMVCGIILQASKGYFNFEIGEYIQTLFGVRLINWLLMCVLAMLIQVIVNNKYVGHFVMIVYYIFTLFMARLGIEHNLFRYASDPGMMYSDMNGYGHFAWPFFVFKVYWGGCALLLAVLSNLYFVRGTETTFRVRRRMARARFNGRMKLLTLFAFVVFAGTGGFIFYNTNILNNYTTNKEQEKEAIRYEKTFGKYHTSPQPKIVESKLNVDIYPAERSLHIKGTYTLKNKTKTPIDSVHVRVSERADVLQLQLSAPSKRVLEDKALGYYIFRLDHPLQPGDSTNLEMELLYEAHGFTNTPSGSGLTYNGTFFNSMQVLPSIGYSEEAELGDNAARKKNGLPEKERMRSVYDSANYYQNAITADADWIRFETVVSTSEDQIAIAPGYLQKDWKEKGRHYFHYKMDVPILNFYAFLSARYEVRRDKWNDVNIEIYYDKKHPYNVDRMIKGIKKSLDYYTKNFSPYQHHQVRIIEFPRYAAFAQSFPNTIPYSEAIGFIANVKDKDPLSIDYPFYVTAHEVAHQWWAHQVIGANVQGSALMIETMAQYSALMVMEKEYGPDKMRKFLKYEMDRYLRGRTTEAVKELPMITMEGQQYIHYNKGSVVMYALKDYIGEDSLNAALRRYIKKTAFQEAPYTNSLEFVNCLRDATPDSLKSIIKDLFETITLFDNRVTAFDSKQMPDGKYKVTMTVEAKKFRADSVGNETEIPVNDWIDIAVFGYVKENGKNKYKALYFEKQHIRTKTTTIEITVDSKPTEGGIDPYNKLIDRIPDDNTGNGSPTLSFGG